MSGKDFGIDRREFVRHSVGVGAGALALGHLPEEATWPSSQSAGLPIIITSHSNDTAREAMRQGWGILYGGGTALDAVERGANVIEVFGIREEADGSVSLDAAYTGTDSATANLIANGKVMDDIFVDDGLHLNEKGTRIWASTIKAVLMAGEAKYESRARGE
mgnify:CR=1 FL=1